MVTSWVRHFIKTHQAFNGKISSEQTKTQTYNTTCKNLQREIDCGSLKKTFQNLHTQKINQSLFSAQQTIMLNSPLSQYPYLQQYSLQKSQELHISFSPNNNNLPACTRSLTESKRDNDWFHSESMMVYQIVTGHLSPVHHNVLEWSCQFALCIKCHISRSLHTQRGTGSPKLSFTPHNKCWILIPDQNTGLEAALVIILPILAKVDP